MCDLCTAQRLIIAWLLALGDIRWRGMDQPGLGGTGGRHTMDPAYMGQLCNALRSRHWLGVRACVGLVSPAILKHAMWQPKAQRWIIWLNANGVCYEVAGALDVPNLSRISLCRFMQFTRVIPGPRYYASIPTPCDYCYRQDVALAITINPCRPFFITSIS